MTEFEHIKKELSTYLSNLSVPDKIADILTSPDFINKPTELYAYYPFLFNKAFNYTDDESLLRLSFAGFFYFKYILLLDQFMDKGKMNKEELILSNILHEESIKLLSFLFPSDSEFWNYWKKRKYEFITAYQMERTEGGVSTFKDFEKLTDYKSAVGKAAIDGLFILSGQKNKQAHTDLLLAHKLGYIATQIGDDIKDFKEDMEEGQFNITIHLLQLKLEEKGKKQENYSIEQLNKLIYIYGIASDLFQRSFKYTEDAIELCQKYHLDTWIRLKQSRLISSRLTKKQTDDYLRTTELKVSLKLSERKEHIAFKVDKENVLIQSSMEKAANFITIAQFSDGSWTDLIIDKLFAETWVTAFVLQNISIAKQLYDSEVLDRASNYLLESKKGLWSMNEMWIEEGITSAWTLLALKNCGLKIGEYLSLWMEYQQDDGGFSSYKDKDILLKTINKENADGWLMSHPCISAIALSILDDEESYRLEIEKLNAYFVSAVKDGLWNSYWWTSPLLTTSFVMQYLANNQQIKEEKLIEKAVIQLIKLQNNDGSFGDIYTKKSAFYTSFAIKALCSSKKIFDENLNAVRKSIIWLIKNQFDDGSWDGTAAIRIPSFEEKDPESIKNWKLQGSYVNIRIKEEYRVLTTAVSLSALYAYFSMNGK